eukprot:TRINITY_DN23912_c0_g1_i3.p1 TRINITY_DN23912_c0_g1~~TRINITY_DN23912_c0_g1_i3.p1  ORF type:complete len:737 (-),score=87.98 TRINITY_DN23912_c0_g1_i3:881-3091(-)
MPPRERNEAFFKQGGGARQDAAAKVKRAYQRCAESGVLNLSEQNLTGALPQEVCGFADSDWAENWWEQCPVTKLDVSHNALESIPPEIAQLADCTSVIAVSNRLRSVPGELLAALPLKQLNLRQNALQSLPAAACAEAVSLVELVVSENELSVLPPEVLLLPQLEILDLSCNRLTTLPDGDCWECARLRHLNISRNQIGPSLPLSLARCAVLRDLAASHNSLVDVNQLLAAAGSQTFSSGWRSSLVSLNLSNNQIGPSFRLNGYEALDSLNVASNRISSLELDGLFSRLSTVVAAGNKIGQFPEALCPDTAPMLATVDFTNNDLQNLPPELGLSKTLKRVALEGNVMRAIRPELLRGGAEKLKAYLRSRIENCPDRQELEQLVADDIAIELRTAGASHELALADKNFTELPELPEGLRVLCIPGSQLAAPALVAALGLPPKRGGVAAQQDLCRLVCSRNRLGTGQNADVLLFRLIDALPELREVNLSYNGISALGSSSMWSSAVGTDFGQSVRVVDLSGNALEEFPAGLLTACRKLNELVLQGNRIHSLDGTAICEGSGLFTLNLEGNRIRSAPAWLPSVFPQLRTFMIANNDIGPSLPPEWGSWLSLQAVTLQGNPLRSMRQNLVVQAWPEVASYLRDRLPEGAPAVAAIPSMPVEHWQREDLGRMEQPVQQPRGVSTARTQQRQSFQRVPSWLLLVLCQHLLKRSKIHFGASELAEAASNMRPGPYQQLFQSSV